MNISDLCLKILKTGNETPLRSVSVLEPFWQPSQLPHSFPKHFSVIISEEDQKLLKRLGISVTCEPRYEINRLYHK